jgi:hypothetical protein
MVINGNFRGSNSIHQPVQSTLLAGRIAFQQEVLAQMQKKNITKLAINNEFPTCTNTSSIGALTYETILSSALAGDRPQSTFMFVNPDDKKKLAGPGKPQNTVQQ